MRPWFINCSKTIAQLVAQNMLEKGHGKDQAEAEIGTLLDVLAWFENASLRLTTPNDQLKLVMAVRFKGEPGQK